MVLDTKDTPSTVKAFRSSGRSTTGLEKRSKLKETNRKHEKWEQESMLVSRTNEIKYSPPTVVWTGWQEWIRKDASHLHQSILRKLLIVLFVTISGRKFWKYGLSRCLAMVLTGCSWDGEWEVQMESPLSWAPGISLVIIWKVAASSAS